MRKKILTLLYFIELYRKKDKFPVRKGQPLNLPRFEISKCKHSSKHWSYHKIAFNSQKAKIWAKAKTFDQFHEN